MADVPARFAVQFPCVRMRANLGGERAIVIIASKPQGGGDMVLATCMDAKGRLHSNIPFTEGALQYAFRENRITLVEDSDAGIVAPSAGLVGLDGRKLG